MVRMGKLGVNNSVITHYSIISDGNMSFFFNGYEEDKKKVLNNRVGFFNKIGVDINKTIGICVEGGNTVLIANEKDTGVSMMDKKHCISCDGLITNKTGISFFLLTADCIPLILYDPINEAVGLIHAGWKGLDMDIVNISINKFLRNYKSNPKDMIVMIGPCARKESYNQKNPTQKGDLKWQGFISQQKGNYYSIDLVGFCINQLIKSGIHKENIFDCGLDTISDTRFFSHYRQNHLPHNQQGRFCTVVGLK